LHLFLFGRFVTIVVNGANNPQSFRPAFSEQYRCTHFQILRPIHKPKLNKASVSSPHQIFIHFQNLCTLPYYSAMDYSLVIRLDSGCMMENFNFSFKIKYAHGVHRLVKQNHAFAKASSLESIFFYHTFDCKTHRLSGICLLN